MKHSFTAFGWIFSLGFALLAGVAGCGDGGTSDASLAGTWNGVSVESEGMSVNCPGVLVLSNTEDVDCGTGSLTFNADGTYVSVETTDSSGAPSNYREEGTWSTQGTALTLTCVRETGDDGTLGPCGDPDPQTGTWNVSGNALSIVFTDPTGTFPPVTLNFEK